MRMLASTRDIMIRQNEALKSLWLFYARPAARAAISRFAANAVLNNFL